MFKKIIKEFKNKFVNPLKNMQLPVLILVSCFLLFILLLLITYFVFWTIYSEHKLADLLNLIHEILSPASIAAVTFIAGCLIDLNGNSIPDALEKFLDKR